MSASRLYATSNIFKLVDNGRVFEYQITDEDNILDQVKEVQLATIIEESFPRSFLTKLVDYRTKTFFSVSFKAQFQVEVRINDQVHTLRFRQKGELSSKGVYMREMARAIMEQGKLINLDGCYFNPFEVNDVSTELSLVPIFSYEVADFIGSPALIVKNDLHLAPNMSLFDVTKLMVSRGIPEDQISEILKGSIIKLNYQSWCSYYKISNFIENSTLDSQLIDIDGNSISLMQFFTEKYPYLDLGDPKQYLIEAVSIQNRFGFVEDCQKRILIPSLVTLLLNEDSYRKVFGNGYFESFNINRDMYDYYYSCKFVGNLMEKEKAKRYMARWKFSIVPKPYMLTMASLPYQPDIELVAPTGIHKLQRNLCTTHDNFRNQALQLRMNQFSTLNKWVVFCPFEIREKAVEILTLLTQCAEHFKYFESAPDCFFVDYDTEDSWFEGIRNKINDSFDFILCFTRKRTKVIYSTLLKTFETLGIKRGLPAIVTRLQIEDTPDLLSAHHMLMKMAAARGDNPWIASQLSENSPTLVCGANIFDCNGYLGITFTFSKNKFFSKYFCKVLLTSTNEKQERLKEIDHFFKKCGSYFQEKVMSGNTSIEFPCLAYIKGGDSDTRAEIARSLGYLGSKCLTVISVKPMKSLGIFPISNPSISESKVHTYRNFAAFFNSHNNKFRFDPQLLTVDLPCPPNSIKFLVLADSYIPERKGRHSYIFSLAYCQGVKIEYLTRWIYDKSVLLGMINYDELNGHKGLPAPLFYADKVSSLVMLDGGHNAKDIARGINNFNPEWALYYGF